MARRENPTRYSRADLYAMPPTARLKRTKRVTLLYGCQRRARVVVAFLLRTSAYRLRGPFRVQSFTSHCWRGDVRLDWDLPRGCNGDTSRGCSHPAAADLSLPVFGRWCAHGDHHAVSPARE